MPTIMKNAGDKNQTKKLGWSTKAKPLIAKHEAKAEDHFKTQKPVLKK